MTAARVDSPSNPAINSASPSVPALKSTPLATSNLRAIEQLKTDLKAADTPDGILVTLPGDVLFDFDQADIRADAKPVLAKIAELIQKTGSGSVQIDGHTDAKGDEGYNLALSDRRAASVKAYLVDTFGIADARLTTRGFGEAKPVAPNAKPDGSDDPEGRQRNRRVEFVIKP